MRFVAPQNGDSGEQVFAYLIGSFDMLHA